MSEVMPSLSREEIVAMRALLCYARDRIDHIKWLQKSPEDRRTSAPTIFFSDEDFDRVLDLIARLEHWTWMRINRPDR